MTNRYDTIKQLPFCCVPACVQMILKRRRLQSFSQEEIGYDLGLTVPIEYLNTFPHAQTGSRPSSGWGTRTQDYEYSLNQFFSKNSIGLKENYIYSEDPEEIKNIIQTTLENNDDVICCYDNAALLKNENKYGHVVLVDNLQDTSVYLIDPEKDHNIKVNLSDLAYAIKITSQAAYSPTPSNKPIPNSRPITGKENSETTRCSMKCTKLR